MRPPSPLLLLLAVFALLEGCLDLSTDSKKFLCPECAPAPAVVTDAGTQDAPAACQCETAPRCEGNIRVAPVEQACTHDGGCGTVQLAVTACPGGCESGACVGEAPTMPRSCATVNCDAPPASTCTSLSVVTSYLTPGTCDPNTAACVYTPVQKLCERNEECQAGRCVDAPDWRRLDDPGQPPVRIEHAMVFDPARGRVLLFGGYQVSDYADTWEHDGIRWRQLAPSKSPPARSGASLAYDAARKEVLLFGGISAEGYLDDTWVWDGKTWTDLQPSTVPPKRAYAGIAYDEARRRLVLFGGKGKSKDRYDTWEWDGADWQEVTPPSGSPTRSLASLGYDPARKRVFAHFSIPGIVGASSPETLSWDGTTWTNLTPASDALHPRSAELSYDPERKRLVRLASCLENDSVALSHWTGKAWAPIETLSRPDRMCEPARGLVWNPVAKHFLYFSGKSTWTFGN